MKVIRIINKSFKSAFQSVFRNFSLSMASISCTAITLILVAIALLVTYNVNSITEDIEDVLTIVVFVDGDKSEDELNDLKYNINSIANVDDGQTVVNTKDQIKEELSEENNDIKNVLDTLSENPLQHTIVVSVKNVKKITDTAEYIEAMDGVTSVKYGESLVNKLVSMIDVIRNGCIIAVIALIIVTAFLIANTIKITIFSRRQEINIMRLVGTSNTVIKLPFLIEGLVLGVLGSILPILITIYGYTFFYDYVGGNLFTNLVVLVKPNQVVYEASLVLLLVGGLVGMFGSLRAVKRYLKI